MNEHFKFRPELKDFNLLTLPCLYGSQEVDKYIYIHIKLKAG